MSIVGSEIDTFVAQVCRLGFAFQGDLYPPGSYGGLRFALGFDNIA